MRLFDSSRIYKKNIPLLIICLGTTLLFSQSKRPPLFLDKTDNTNSYDALCCFISNLDDSITSSAEIRPCYAGLGVFKFTVTETGAVDIVKFTGDLPPIIVNQIKSNILKTSGMWAPQLEYDKPTESLPFVLIYYVDIDLGKGKECEKSPLYNRNKASLGWELEQAFNTSKNRDIIITNNAYILPVGGLIIVR